MDRQRPRGEYTNAGTWLGLTMAKRKRTDAIETEDPRTIPQSWVAASLTPGESQTSRWANNTGRDYDLVSRGVTGTAWRAASINATVISGQTLRLYRRAGVRDGVGEKVADRQRVKYLTGRGPVRPLIGKSMTYASRSGDEIEEVVDHPVLELLQNPDPVYTGPLWLWMLSWFKEIAGRTYLYVGERNSLGYPVSAYIMPSEYAWPMLDDTGLIAGYYYGRNRSSPMRIDAADVLYLRQHGSPVHPAGGVSWLSSVIPETDMEAAALQAEAARWSNGGMPGMVFKAHPQTTDAQMSQINAHLAQSIRGVSKAGNFLLLRDTELQQYGTKPHEMQYVEGITTTEKRIYDAAGIPEPIYRLNSANLASATVANAQYMRYSIAPRLAVLASELTEMLLPQFGIAAGEMFFAHDNPVQDDQIALAAELRAAESQGLITPNEYRRIMDLEALPDEANALRYRQTSAPDTGSIFGMGLQSPTKSTDMPSADVGSVDVDAGDDTASVDTDATTETPSVDVDEVATASTDADATAGNAVATAAKEGDAASTALNGAQVQALADLAREVAAGQLPGDTARAIALAAFPLVPSATLDAIFGPLESFTPTPTDVASATTPVAKAMATKAESYTPNDGMQAEAERGLAWRREYGRGGTEVGVARARDIVNGRGLSLDTVYRMASYFARHEVDKQGQGWSPDEDGYPSAGRIAWALWGGDPGRSWAARIIRSAEAEDEDQKGDAGQYDPPAASGGMGDPDDGPSEPDAPVPIQTAQEGEACPPRIKVPTRCKALATIWDDDTGVPAMGSAIYRKFRDRLEAWYREVVPSMINDAGVVVAPSPDQMAAFDAITQTFIADTLAVGAKMGLDKIGLDKTTWTTANETAMAYVRNRGLELATSVPDTLRDSLNATIERELAQGFTITTIKDEIMDKMPELSGYQAERLARTETSMAFVEGQRQVWATEGVETKTWLVGGGQCDLCDAVHEQYPNPVAINDLFITDEWTGQGPPLHPNCRCDLAPGVEYSDA